MNNLEQLNRQQQLAVLHGEGPLLILAGAGSGKTRVITHRIARLILEEGVRHWNILAVTFTNKAAREMAERVRFLMGSDDIPLISTFHSACGRILRKDIAALGYESSFVIYDDKDSERLLKDLINNLNLDEKRFPAKAIGARIDDCKNRGLLPDKLSESELWNRRFIEIYAAYQESLRRCNALDFGDLILQTVRLFEHNPDLLAYWQNRFQWLLVDEYQDTNPAQYQLIRLLAGERKNLCVVGDDDQSIYSWRGADIRNILEFEKDFPGVTVIRLEQNYRSTSTILKAAGSVVSRNIGRKVKTLWTENKDGEMIRLVTLENDRLEARFVITEIQALAQQGLDLTQIAVFYRTNAQSRLLEEALTAEGIPYRLVGGVRFYSRMEIKDVLCYLRMLENPADEISVKRIVNVPSRGIGAATLERVSEISVTKQMTLHDAFEYACSSEMLASGTRKKVSAFVELMRGLRVKAATSTLSELVKSVLNDTGYLMRLKESHDPDDAERVENLAQLVSAVEEFSAATPNATLADFLEQVALVSDLDQGGTGANAITLMTLHSAKGLEFDTVFMVGMEDRLFPHIMTFDDRDGMEEERRLCYVGMTRARERLYLLNARRRMVFGMEQTNLPSRFLKEIPKEYICKGTDKRNISSQPHIRPSGTVSSLKSHNLASVTPVADELVIVPEVSDDICENCIGLKVRHAKFGVGTIRKTEGHGDNQKVVVWFSESGPKKLLVRYAGLERV